MSVMILALKNEQLAVSLDEFRRKQTDTVPMTELQ